MGDKRKMTKEEIKQEAEEKLPQVELDYCHGFINPCEPNELPYIELVRFRTGFERGYLAGAEPREKRIADLTEQNTSLLTSVENLNKSVQELGAEVKEWKDKADLWCKTANLKDHNIMINKELEEENARLKEINTHTLSQLNLDNGELITELTKAKDHIKKLLDCLKQDTNDPQTNYYVCQYMDKAEQFLKDSEVPKWVNIPD